MNRFIPYIIPATAAFVISVPAAAISYLSLEKAQEVCFAKATRFEQANVIFTEEQIKEMERRTEKKVRTKGQQIWNVWKDKKFLGYFILDYVIGKHEVIDYVVALDPDGKVKQIEILTYRESYGYEIRNKSWRKQFVGKDRHSALKIHKDIINIGGATLSCRHVTEGVKKVLAVYEIILKKDSPKG